MLWFKITKPQVSVAIPKLRYLKEGNFDTPLITTFQVETETHIQYNLKVELSKSNWL